MGKNETVYEITMNKQKKSKPKFKIVPFRNTNDFKFGCWSYVHYENGGGMIYGVLKKNNNRCKYQEIKIQNAENL